MKAKPTIRRTDVYRPYIRAFPQHRLAPAEARALEEIARRQCANIQTTSDMVSQIAENVNLLAQAYINCLSECFIKVSRGTEILDPPAIQADNGFKNICGEQYIDLRGFIEKDVLIVSHCLAGVQRIQWIQMEKMLCLRGLAFKLLYGKLFQSVAKV